MNRWTWAATLMVAILLLGVAASSAADNDPGEAQYRKYCGACHGLDGKGDGAAAGYMRPKPTDLTRLAKKAGGTFPFVDTMRVIDGRRPIKAHGDSEMPVWGEIFTAESGQTIDTHARVRGKVLLITEYLASIQQK